MFKLYTAPWCSACQVVKKHLEVHIERGSVGLVDVDENQEEALKVGIRSIPTLVAPNGEKLLGNQTLGSLLNFISNNNTSLRGESNNV